MKKILLGILIVVVLVFAGSYFFIPEKLKISGATAYQGNGEGIFRFLNIDSNWKKWWPGEISKNVFSYSGYDYNIEMVRYLSFELNVAQNKDSYKSLLKVIKLKTDSVGIEIGTELNTGHDPISRIANYFKAKKIKNNFDDVLASLKEHTNNVKDIYQFDIRNEKVEMQYLLSTSKLFPHYPTTEDVYSLVNIVRAHISTTGGKEEFSPMLNIETSDSVNYFVRIGVPVNKKTPESKDISLKQMVKDGNILVTEVKGDTKTINAAVKQVEQYIHDYQRSIIAIPFQSLVTDRSKEPDSTKWVTRIYYPVV